MDKCKFTNFIFCMLLLSLHIQANAYKTLDSPVNGIVGKISDRFEVTPLGQANYEMLIKTLQGTGGMEPKLSLGYNSLAKDGLLGFGFDLLGLSVISRTPSNLHNDGQSNLVSFSNWDKFALDGLRLVEFSSSFDRREFRTENDSHSRIIAEGSDFSNPKRFIVYSKSGVTSEYRPSSSIVKNGKAMFWLLNKVSDTKGNYYTVSYVEDVDNNDYRPDRIDYTGNDSVGLAPFASVRFKYRENEYAAVIYAYGQKVKRSKLLSEIEIYYGEALVRKYDIHYRRIGTRCQIDKVTEFAGDGSKKNPTTFEWYDNNQFSAKNCNFDREPNLYRSNLTVGDFNGDGRSDFVATPRDNNVGWTGWKLYLSKGSSFRCASTGQQPLSGEIRQVVSGDFNGDGYDDIVIKRKTDRGFTNLDLYLSKGEMGGFEFSNCFFSNRRDYNIQTVEVTGDGVSDVFIYFDNSNDFELISSSSSRYSVRPLDFRVSGHCFSANWDKVDFGDFDGDGRTDVVNRHDGGYTILYGGGQSSSYIYDLKGTWPNRGHHVYYGDFNGDGKTDMLLTGWDGDPNTFGWSTWCVCYSTGDGFEKKYIPGSFYSREKRLLIADINGDGKDDFYAVPHSIASGNMAGVQSYINDGSGYNFVKMEGGSVYGLDKWNFNVGDFNGDGKQEFICTSTWENGSSWNGYQVFLIPEEKTNLLKTITDGIGYSIGIAYKCMSDVAVFERGNVFKYPLTSFGSSLPVVSSITTPDGIGGVKQTSYSYKNALLNKYGRGNLGFEYFVTKDNTSGIETVQKFEVNTTEYITALKMSDSKLNGKLLSREVYDNSLSYPYAYKCIFAFRPNRILSEKYEYNSGEIVANLSTNYEYDTNGNVVKSVVVSNGKTITTINKYNDNVEKWYLGRLAKVTVTKTNGEQSQAHNSAFEYDKKSGLLTEEIFEPENSKYGYRKSYTHDAFGNIIKSVVMPLNPSIAARETRSEYDLKGRFLVTQYNALGHKSENIIDEKLGVLAQMEDENGKSTKFSYNSFGELIETLTSLGREKQIVAWSQGHIDAPQHSVTCRSFESTGNPNNIEFYDILGRVIRKVTWGMDGKKIYHDKVYNTRGELFKVSEPYYVGNTIYWNVNEYDDLGRVVRQVAPDQAAYTMSYNGFTTESTDPEGHTTRKNLDQDGNLVESIDADGVSVKYKYNVEGKCVSIEGPRTTVRMEYDDFGHKTKLIDPDLGVYKYDYNSYGEIIEEVDPNGFTTFFTYDKIGRLIKEQRNDVTISNEYDTKWIGSLSKSESSNGMSVKYHYDTFGRQIQVDEQINNKCFSTQQTYNGNNQLETITYPSGFVIENTYTPTGYLFSVSEKNKKKVLWTASSMTARGQLEKVTYGNGLLTTKNYNDAKGYVAGILTPGVQNWEYVFNTLGNLSCRKNVSRGLTESFVYDALGRLTEISCNGEVREKISYDLAGNVIEKTRVGKFTYFPENNRLASIESWGYKPPEWDKVENTSFNKVAYLFQGKDTLFLAYGVDKRRKMSRIAHGGDKTVKYYVGNIYEEEYSKYGTKKINYVYAVGELVAICCQSNTKGEMLMYVHHDHIGSIQAYSDERGTLVQELSYDAWGVRRKPEDWTRYNMIADADACNERGFTGHEHLDIFELVNMDGRMYDPFIGRFLSPDPFSQTPDFSQGLNRYAYCLNNPLSLYDPTGYSWFSKNWKSLVAATVGIAVSVVTLGTGSTLGAVIIAGAVGGAAGALTGALLNGANFVQTAKSTLIGGILGAASGFLKFASADPNLLASVFKHTFSQGFLEGIQGGNILHGFIAGATSGVGGHYINKFGGHLSNIGKITANAVLSGSVEELGGGKFANGAVTGAFSMMFNDLMHSLGSKRIEKIFREYLMASFDETDKWISGSKLAMNVGGEVYESLKDIPAGKLNSCALRLSVALNNAGVSLAYEQGVTLKGADGKNYIVNAAKLYGRLRRIFYGNIKTYTHQSKVPSGVPFIDGHYFGNASGHVDIVHDFKWGSTGGNGYYDDGLDGREKHSFGVTVIR